MVAWLLTYAPPIIVAMGLGIIAVWLMLRLASFAGFLLDTLLTLMRAWVVFRIVAKIHRDEVRYQAFTDYLRDHELTIRKELEETRRGANG